MTRIVHTARLASLALLALLVGTSACRTAHLGPDTAAATRAALAAQRASHSEAAPGFGAADAHATLAARRGAKGREASAPALSPSAMPMSGAGGGGDWQGSKAPISLEAK